MMKDEDKININLEELEELHRTKELFEGLFEFAPDAIVVVDNEGSIERINRQAEKIFGYKKEEVIGKQVEMLIPERFRETHKGHLRDYMSEPRIRPMGAGLELYARKKDGSEFQVDISLGPLETEKGTVVLSIIRDITEHRQMEEALMASESKYRSIFENAVEGIFRTSVDGRIVAANQALASMLGYASPEELMANVTDFRKLYVEPGRRVEFVHTMKSTGIVKEFEALFHHRESSKIWVMINAHGIKDAKGRLVGFEGMATDITGRKRAEKNFQMLLESAPDAMIVIDSDYNISLLNSQTENLFGYTEEELLDRPYDILIPDRFRKEHTTYCKSYFAEPTLKTMALHLGATAKHRDGSEFPVEINMSPVETREGMNVVIDIRSRKEEKMRSS